MPGTFPALVLASGTNRVSLYPGYVPDCKAALPLAGRPSIQYVLDALAAAPEIGRITVMGPGAVLSPLLAGAVFGAEVHLCEGGEDLVDSLRRGLEQGPAGDPVLVTTGDLPLLTAAAVTDFLRACRAEPGWGDPRSLFLAVVPKSAYVGPYRHFTKPFNHFRDVVICHGNLAVVHPRLLDNREAMDHLQSLYELRKHPIASALSGGLRIGLEFLIGVDTLHLLSLEHVAQTISRELRLQLTPVLTPHPEVTLDVDDADDYRFVLEQLERRSGRPAPVARPGFVDGQAGAAARLERSSLRGRRA